MSQPGSVSRRTFLERSATTAAVTLASRHALGEPRSSRRATASTWATWDAARRACGSSCPRCSTPTCVSSPSATQPPERGLRRVVPLRGARQDPRVPSATRVGRGLVFLPCGREVGRELVDRHYGASAGGGCGVYADFREMLAREKDLDAVYVMTPDHLHATIALAAMKARKHVIMHKRWATSSTRRASSSRRRARQAWRPTCTAPPGWSRRRRSPSGSRPVRSGRCARCTTGPRGPTGRRA